jgi:hypothetical protein
MDFAREVLIKTLEDVNVTETPDDLRQIAFSKTFDLRAGIASPQAGASGAASGAAGTGASGGAGSAVSGDKLALVAAKAGTDREVVGEVYEIVDGNLELIIPAGKLSDRVASGAKEIALLIAGGRQAAEIEDWTSLDVVRAVCTDFKRLDSANFAKTIKQMEDVFNVRKESERKTQVRMSRPGWEAFGVLVKRLGGGS